MKELNTDKEWHIATRNLQKIYSGFGQNCGYRETMKRLKDHFSGKRRDILAYIYEDILFKTFKSVNYSRGY